jgi:hypothetical protein
MADGMRKNTRSMAVWCRHQTRLRRLDPEHSQKSRPTLRDLHLTAFTAVNRSDDHIVFRGHDYCSCNVFNAQKQSALFSIKFSVVTVRPPPRMGAVHAFLCFSFPLVGGRTYGACNILRLVLSVAMLWLDTAGFCGFPRAVL